MAGSLDPLVTEALRSWRVQLDAGIPSPESLELCAGVLRGSDRECFLRASKLNADGKDIVTILDALSPLLSSAERAIIAAGWNSGRVEATLDALVRQRELWRNARQRILSKLMLPVGTLLMASFIAPLPGLIAGDGSVFAYLVSALMPLTLAAGVAIGAVLFFKARANAPVAYADGTPIPPSNFDRVMLAIPLVGHIERQRCLAEFGDLLSNLLNAGAAIVPALDTTARAMRNGCYRAESVRLSRNAAQGHPLAPALREESTGLWPREFSAAVAVGEQSGALDASLARLSEASRDRYIRAIETLAEWLPKIIYGIVSLFVIYNILKMAMMYNGMLNDTLNSIGK